MTLSSHVISGPQASPKPLDVHNGASWYRCRRSQDLGHPGVSLSSKKQISHSQKAQAMPCRSAGLELLDQDRSFHAVRRIRLRFGCPRQGYHRSYLYTETNSLHHLIFILIYMGLTAPNFTTVDRFEIPRLALAFLFFHSSLPLAEWRIQYWAKLHRLNSSGM